MLNLPFLLTAVLVSVAVGVGLSAWVRSARRRKLEVEAGIRSLAAMRWREFSRFVIEALQAQGFEAARGDVATQSAQEADLVLDRNGETWLLSVKQGANYRITAAMVAELARAVRFKNAQGGILATLGTIEPGAGQAHPELELLDGATLWPVVEPLLPPSLHQDIDARAQSVVRKEVGFAWGAAIAAGLVLGAGVGLVFSGSDDDDAYTPPPIAAAPRPTAPAPAAASTPAAAAATAPDLAAPPVSEQAKRDDVLRTITTISGVERAAWTTRSTLVLYMSGAASDAQVKAICALIERHDTLRATRLQLQPPPGSSAPVRFKQCRAF